MVQSHSENRVFYFLFLDICRKLPKNLFPWLFVVEHSRAWESSWKKRWNQAVEHVNFYIIRPTSLMQSVLVVVTVIQRLCTQLLSDPSVHISKVQEVSVSSFIPHPLCVAGVFLTSLTSESGSKVQHTSREAESLLLNVSGKLLMFQRDRSGPQIRQNNENHKHRVVG